MTLYLDCVPTKETIADDTRMSRFSENWTNHLKHPDNSKAFRNRRRNTDVEFEKALSRVSTV